MFKIAAFPSAPATSAAVLGDTLDMTPEGDAQLLVWSVSKVSAPAGSTANFAPNDAAFTPDVVGRYVLAVNAGA